jgi:hypothetical protein
MARHSKAETIKRKKTAQKAAQRESKKVAGVVEVRLEIDGYFLSALLTSLEVNNRLLAECNEPTMDLGEYIELLIANTETAPEAPDYITVDATKYPVDLNMHELARDRLNHKFYAPADYLELYVLRNCGFVDPFACTTKKQLYFQHPCFPVKVRTNLYHGEVKCYNPITGLEDGPVRDKYQVRFALRESGCKKIPYHDMQDLYEAECLAAGRKANPAPKKTRAQLFERAMATSPNTDTVTSRKQTW